MIDSSFGPDDRAFLERAQLIVLAGGDVRLGWNTFETTGMKDVILGRYAQGAVLGAFQPARSSSDAMESSRHRNPPRPGCSRCSSSSPCHRRARRARRVGAASRTIHLLTSSLNPGRASDAGPISTQPSPLADVEDERFVKGAPA